MQSHPSHPRLAGLINKYPKSASALFQTFNDVTLAHKWTDIQVLELPQCGRGAIKGLRPSLTAGEPSSTCVVVPCGLAESISTSWIRDAFAALDTQLADAPETLFVAICSGDSSIVYYKISKGIIKPQV
ncbi:tRNA intron endonuclease [Boletus edulis BED1]|uniref:tRNA intron endonuclease n=1 Tax=Boletus edulis BED1 TaxID=1328754 RepID=A0AAD4C0L4_BOLED|nr:tRNA intron endonuclease [Boletus edulis BED1]